MHEFVLYHVNSLGFINATCLYDCNEALQFVYVCIMITKLDDDAEMLVNITRVCIAEEQK